ncbi:MAG: hypothetical protein U9Q15_02785 [Patescibacteria group bacterium]|nr:hypothetical protein [Patescibacteria group bacterium]
MYSYYKDIVFRTDHGYGSGDKMKKITEKQKSILDAIGKDHEKNPYMSLSEEVLTVYIHHILVKKFGYDMVQVFKTNDFDDTFRKTDYIVSIDGEYVAIDLYMGDDDVAIRNKESAATVVNNLDFQTTKDGL